MPDSGGRNTSGPNDYAVEPDIGVTPIYDASYVLKFRGPSYIATLKKINLLIAAITELQVAVSKLNKEVNRLELNQAFLRGFSKIAAKDINELQSKVGISTTSYDALINQYEERSGETFP